MRLQLTAKSGYTERGMSFTRDILETVSDSYNIFTEDLGLRKLVANVSFWLSTSSPWLRDRATHAPVQEVGHFEAKF